jgi:hypothetical protein
MLTEKERVTVKNHKEYFMILTASIVGMDPRVLVAYNFYKDMIPDKIDAKMAAVALATMPMYASVSSPAVASASTPAAASASVSTLAMTMASTPAMASPA